MGVQNTPQDSTSAPQDSTSAPQDSTSAHIAEQPCQLHLQKRFLDAFEERKKVYENLCVFTRRI